MLKKETIKELKQVFNFNTEISEFIPDKKPGVKVEGDRIYIQIYDRIHPETIKEAIFNILYDNSEPGPLNIHVETATSCRLTLYAEITRG